MFSPRFVTERLRRLAVYMALATICLSTIHFVRQDLRRVVADLRNWWAGDIVDFAYADNTTGFEFDIVPNIVHFVKLGDDPLSLVDAVSVRAASLQQRPDVLMIHCDNCQAVKKSTYWNLVGDISELVLRDIERPTEIFGLKLVQVEHAADLACIKVLMEYGGIYLNTDTYLVKSLNRYRHYEMSVGWYPGEDVATQIIVSHKNARFLRLWHDSFQYYRPDLWYWSAGDLSTEMFLLERPHLVHRVPYAFGVHNLSDFLYEQCNENWTEYSAINLIYRHQYNTEPTGKLASLQLDKVAHYNRTYGQMARLVLFGTTKMGPNGLKNNSWLRNKNLEYAEGACQ